MTGPWAWLVKVDTAWREKRDTAPLPLLRWSGAVGIFAGQWIAGIPAGLAGWICPSVIAGLLILPDAGSISFGTMKVEMRQAKEEVRHTREGVERLGAQIQQLQVQQAAAASSANGNTVYVLPDAKSADALRGSVAATTAVKAGEDTGSLPIEQVYESVDADLATEPSAAVLSGT